MKTEKLNSKNVISLYVCINKDAINPPEALILFKIIFFFQKINISFGLSI